MAAGLRARHRGSAAVLLAAAGAAAVLLASCATAPVRAPSEWMGVLPGDATMYASLSVGPSAGLVKKLLTGAGPGTSDIAQLVDRTKRVVLAVRLVPQGKPSFAAVAIGSYPSGVMNCRLSGNREWKKAKSPAGSYWQWSRTAVQLAIPGRSVLLAANGEIDTLLGRYGSPVGLRIPEEVALDMLQSDLVLYLPELPGGIARSDSVHVPIQEVWIDAAKGQGSYAVTGTANTGSEREAKLVALVLKLALVAWMRSQNLPNLTERLRPVTITADGSQVKLAGLALSEEEIGLLFLSLITGPRAADGTGP